MEMKVEDGRIYYPPDDPNRPNERKVCHPETNSDQVLFPDGRTLTEVGSSPIVISETKPVGSALWGKIRKTLK